MGTSHTAGEKCVYCDLRVLNVCVCVCVNRNQHLQFTVVSCRDVFDSCNLFCHTKTTCVEKCRECCQRNATCGIRKYNLNVEQTRFGGHVWCGFSFHLCLKLFHNKYNVIHEMFLTNQLNMFRVASAKRAIFSRCSAATNAYLYLRDERSQAAAGGIGGRRPTACAPPQIGKARLWMRYFQRQRVGV